MSVAEILKSEEKLAVHAGKPPVATPPVEWGQRINGDAKAAVRALLEADTTAIAGNGGVIR